LKTILLINSSPRGAQSASRALSLYLLERLKAQTGPLNVVERDLSTTPLPFLDLPLLQALDTPEPQRSPEQHQLLSLSDSLVDELLAADWLVLGAPMWNFSSPASVKAWIDLVARAGRTFNYSEAGPQGLVPDKPAFLIKSSGGVFSEGPAKALDFQEPYLKAFLNFIGLKQVTFIRAEGLALPGQYETRMEAARRQIDAALRALKSPTD